jgi:ABC-type branched-subunit amino acid transport system substrate-binding protein
MMQTGTYKSPCLLHQDDEYGRNVLGGFTQQLEAMKIQPVGVATYKRGASDFSAQTARLKATGCDLLVLGTVIRETIAVMTEAKRTGWDVTVLGATPTNVPEVPQLGKENVEGLYAAGYLQVPDEATATGALKDWLKAYDKRFGIPANTQAILGYNAIMAFATYARLAGKDLNGPSLLAALESGKPYNDIFRSPPIAFSPTNHLGSTVTQIQQVKDGRWEVVSEGLTF